VVVTVVATGRTSGWAFLASSPVAYERVGATAWKPVAMPEKGGAVGVAGATSPGNVWAAYSAQAGTHVDRWNGSRWTVMRSFPGQVSSLSVLGPNDVWVFGGLPGQTSQGVFHFDGRHWTEVAKAWQGGSALSDRDVWAYSGTTIGHFDGRRWTEANVAGLFPAKTAGETTTPVLLAAVPLLGGQGRRRLPAGLDRAANREQVGVPHSRHFRGTGGRFHHRQPFGRLRALLTSAPGQAGGPAGRTP
jgi:hypothetical protein